MLVEWILLFLQIMIINLVLSGDNAVVIAMASKNLPARDQKRAVFWGAFGAIGLRVVLTLLAVAILQVPYLQAAGSLLLLWIAVKLLTDHEEHTHVKQASTLGKAVWTIILADFIMSLDNVLAIAAKADNNMTVILLGIGLSVPIIIWGSSVVMKLLHRYPILIYLGAGILGYTGGEMLIQDRKAAQWLPGEAYHWAIPLTAAAVVILIGLWNNQSRQKAY